MTCLQEETLQTKMEIIFVTIGAPGSPFSIPVVGIPTQSTGAATNLVISSSQNPSTVGQSVTLTATVTPGSGSVTPTGTVTFFEGGSTQLGTPVMLNSQGKATFTTTSLPLGLNSITINYSGDATYAPENSSGFVQNVNAAATAATTTTLASSANPSIVGQHVTFTATVTSLKSGTITGMVTFLDGTTSLGTGPLTSGSATFAATSLTVGSHSITAHYGGDTNFSGGTSSPAVSQTVNKALTSTNITSSLESGGKQCIGDIHSNSDGRNAPGAGTPTGTVTFLEGATGTTLGTGSAATGLQTFTTASLAVGSHSVNAQYGGDSNFNGSTSVLLQTVNNGTQILTLSATSPGAVSVVAGQTTTPITVTASSPNAMPQTVTFACSGLPVKATCMFSPGAVVLTAAVTAAPVSITIMTTANSLVTPRASLAATRRLDESAKAYSSLSCWPCPSFCSGRNAERLDWWQVCACSWW